MTEGKCPSCGGPVEFPVGSLPVVVCPFCSTVVAKKGLRLERYGKVGALVDTGSPLKLMLDGTYRQSPFRLAGHLQKDNGRGALWDEWLVAFDEGPPAWLVESEGELRLLTAAKSIEINPGALQPGARFEVGGREFTVEETGKFVVKGAAGQLPEGVGKGHLNFVDATGADGGFASLEFPPGATEAVAYVGRPVTLEELGFSPTELTPKVNKVALQDARCPNCNGSLELRAPDLTKRVACPYCAALIDVSEGKLQFLELLTKPQRPPRIALGKRGKLRGTDWMVIGYLERFCVVEGVRYSWEEYLLFSKGRNFSWLMDANGHFTHLTPIPAGAVTTTMLGATYRGRSYKAFQRVIATTDRVLGEFYWEVAAGERAEAIEYVAPPESLNSDQTDGELSWTFGNYIPPAELEAAFGVKTEPEGVAPSQPNPHSAGSSFVWATIWAGLALALHVLLAVISPEKLLYERTIAIAPQAASGSPEAMFFDTLEVPSSSPLIVKMSSSAMSQTWLGVSGDLVHDETQEVTAFYGELYSYQGNEGGELWSESNTEAEQRLSTVDPGRYTLRFTPSFAIPVRSYAVQISTAGPNVGWLVFVWGALFAWPFLVLVQSSTFEGKRWGESNLAHGSGSDDE